MKQDDYEINRKDSHAVIPNETDKTIKLHFELDKDSPVVYDKTKASINEADLEHIFNLDDVSDLKIDLVRQGSDAPLFWRVESQKDCCVAIALFLKDIHNMNNPSLKRVFENELSEKKEWVSYCKKTILSIVEITGFYIGDSGNEEVKHFEAFHRDSARFRIKFAVPKVKVPTKEKLILEFYEGGYGGNLFAFDSETIKNIIIPAVYQGIWGDSAYYGEAMDNPSLRDISKYEVGMY